MKVLWRRGSAAGLLTLSLVLSIATPVYLAHAARHIAVYLKSPVIILGQAVPYVVAAAIWLPWRAPATVTAGLIVAGALFVAALFLYLPMLWAADRMGGDMVGFAFLLISFFTTIAVLLASAIGGIVLWLRVRSRRMVA